MIHALPSLFMKRQAMPSVQRTDIARGATLSACRRYRYLLTRSWNPSAPTVLFIGLNPSTADAEHDDATSRICMRYAQRWGFGTLLLANLFAWRATQPADLFAAARPIGPRNNHTLRALQAQAQLVICAWGAHGTHLGRDRAVLEMLHAPHCLTRLRGGQPGHPLYKRMDLLPTPYRA